ncbi:MAG: hypothetical protein JWO70_769 [Betaproteobacteria bacterium]|nr:hypothetical protein [Betaproteobacteria bacterium]
MSRTPDLEALLGKTISAFCGNRFHDPNANHSAHFVSHVLGFNFSFNCREYLDGKQEGGNIRVHEIFAHCPRVGWWEDADERSDLLVFVVRRDAVDLARKKMQNIPQKHMGIYSGGLVYHYNNSRDRVVKQTPADFLKRFQTLYAGDQALFFGTYPLSLAEPAAKKAPAVARGDGYAFEVRLEGREWYGVRSDIPESQEFLLGVELIQPAKKFHGLCMPPQTYYGPVYEAKAYAGIDHWAYLLDVTGYCESTNRFNVVNTYDRAQFTFGFYQFAAHTPRDNLILFFRGALLDEEFQKLFPDLELRAGRVFHIAADGTATDLEEQVYDAKRKEYTLKHFMNYLNPGTTSIDPEEVLNAARLVWWANESEECARLQVATANEILRKKFAERYVEWYELDGELDIVCAIIADIHHQGRGTKTQVLDALSADEVEPALLDIGRKNYASRIATLKERINHWRAAGTMGEKRYRAELNGFTED